MAKHPLPAGFVYPPEAADDVVSIMAGCYDVPLLNPPKTIRDIGANVGLFAIWAAQEWPGAILINCHEPDAENGMDLYKNTEALPNVHRFPMAIAGESGKRWLFKGRNRMCRNIVSGATAESDGLHQVMGAHSLRSSEFIKIDVEGAEIEIIPFLNLEKTRAIVVETHSPEITQTIIANLTSRGFDLWRNEPTVEDCRLLKFIRHGEPLKADAPAALNTQRFPVKKLFLALPVYGGYDPHFIGSYTHLLMNPPVSLSVGVCMGDSLVARARNKLAMDFLASDCSHLLFLDADLIFRTEHIRALCEHALPIVAGLYPKKQKQLAWVINTFPGENPDENGLQRVKYAGTGCLMIAREVFTAIMEKFGDEIKYRTDHGQVPRDEYDFFRCGPLFDEQQGHTRYHSEDWGFCWQAQRAGFEVMVDTRVVLQHVGSCIYPLSDPFEPLDEIREQKAKAA